MRRRNELYRATHTFNYNLLKKKKPEIQKVIIKLDFVQIECFGCEFFFWILQNTSCEITAWAYNCDINSTDIFSKWNCVYSSRPRGFSICTFATWSRRNVNKQRKKIIPCNGEKKKHTNTNTCFSLAMISYPAYVWFQETELKPFFLSIF